MNCCSTRRKCFFGASKSIEKKEKTLSSLSIKITIWRIWAISQMLWSLAPVHLSARLSVSSLERILRAVDLNCSILTMPCHRVAVGIVSVCIGRSSVKPFKLCHSRLWDNESGPELLDKWQLAQVLCRLWRYRASIIILIRISSFCCQKYNVDIVWYLFKKDGVIIFQMLFLIFLLGFPSRECIKILTNLICMYIYDLLATLVKIDATASAKYDKTNDCCNTS